MCIYTYRSKYILKRYTMIEEMVNRLLSRNVIRFTNEILVQYLVGKEKGVISGSYHEIIYWKKD